MPASASSAISSSRVAGLAQDLGGVLAEERRRAPVQDAPAVERQRQRRQSEVRDLRVGEVLHQLERLGLRRGEDVGDVRDRCCRDARAGEPLVPGGGVVLREVRLEQSDQRLTVRDAVGVRAEARVDRQVIRAELAAEKR